MISRAMLTRVDIEAAAARSAGRVRVTPISQLEPQRLRFAGAVTLKLELLQHTGSFKPRGAFSHILSQPVPEAGVIAASGGNHGAAVAYAARELGHRAEIYVPAGTPADQARQARAIRCQVVAIGARYAEALAASCAARAGDRCARGPCL